MEDIKKSAERLINDDSFKGYITRENIDAIFKIIKSRVDAEYTNTTGTGEDNDAKDARHRQEYEELMGAINAPKDNEVLRYLHERDKALHRNKAVNYGAVDIQEHFRDARASRELRQMRLVEQMEIGRHNQDQRLLEKLRRNNEVRLRNLELRNVPTRGQTPACVFPQNPIYNSAVGSL